ncbi:DNA-binding MarR family transcriptional regulator [Chromobacterium alkanivorans]|uniref:MarR family winged helix-turn-helix transcriptional regulator n=1 Tax=Chromobacterium TaxID=535 RepID=UPI0006532BCB|nr:MULTISPECIES: MarR family transcriptional regulator [Chromobacterium]KMN83610.1 MarR family transcriptional regulator [Chromobacterium sp. LK11]MBN3005202.1 MarR family transcriptional regulator [Chromobacterium alkanivorans]MCS3806228.1 DNA-binding MarR family transcriptional regulator [Chromobacterium alkanivorans]MCS3820370.1 DNA-binding MarR family transcriptional regulator [Chromobacterium alkanivorans]MCS3875128.1 DNA-binding MarR family transcriptional regulator [Chromobacterium alka
MADLSPSDDMRAAMEAFFHAYKAFTDKPDEMLAKRGLARVHHRILFFVARYPGLSVKDLLAALGVTKQAINMPLRQLLEMALVQSVAAPHDKRVKQLTLTSEGRRLEEALHREQLKLLQAAFEQTGKPATAGWMQINRSLAAHSRPDDAPSRGKA